MKIYAEGGRCLITAEAADTFIKRFKGLMCRPSLAPGEGLLLTPCSSIHTCFMRFPIDVVYLSGNYMVLDIESIPPWRIGKHVAGTKLIVEMAAGCAAELQIGTQLFIDTSR